MPIGSGTIRVSDKRHIPSSHYRTTRDVVSLFLVNPFHTVKTDRIYSWLARRIANCYLKIISA